MLRLAAGRLALRLAGPGVLAVAVQPLRQRSSANASARPPHEILGVSAEASLAEVKSAYYRLATQLHPDVNKAPDAHERFIEVGDAYRELRERHESNAARASAESGLRPENAETKARFLAGLWEDHIQRSPLASRMDKLLFGHDDHTLVESLLRKGDLASALDVLEDIKAAGQKPTQPLFAMLIRGCTIAMRRPPPGTPLDKRDHLTSNLHAKARELFLEMQVVHKLRPYHSTIHDMIRAHGKAGDFESAHRLFMALIYEKHHRPSAPTCNSMLEIAAATGNYAAAHEYVEMLHGSRALLRALYRPDATTFSLAMRNAVDGKLFDRVPEQLRLFSSVFLKPNQATAERIVSAALDAGQPAAALAIAETIKAIGAKIPETLAPRLEAARGAAAALTGEPNAAVLASSAGGSQTRRGSPD